MCEICDIAKTMPKEDRIEILSVGIVNLFATPAGVTLFQLTGMRHEPEIIKEAFDRVAKHFIEFYTQHKETVH